MPDFTTAPWCDVTPITPRNTAKDIWNCAAVKKHCRMTGNWKYVVPAEDTVVELGDVPDMRMRLAVAALKDEATNNLKHRVELLKAMVTLNISTEADVANGTQGTVDGIVLDPRELNVPSDDNGCVHLRRDS
ncbi:hypothetical protein BYT27DRAFT_7202404 [Phlegmacium glaucopus]|nr:hypothetical protein BYT27DRAFT_7202404 [Phlegmacium glaucopus]